MKQKDKHVVAVLAAVERATEGVENVDPDELIVRLGAVLDAVYEEGVRAERERCADIADLLEQMERGKARRGAGMLAAVHGSAARAAADIAEAIRDVPRETGTSDASVD